ncbi:MAG TPA: PQQ-binding-like beta-propeller repeat protein [Candidatus Acidoferrales bacterium]|jgi:polyvinyl alcohol dehydrogenase (cytochrome)|nr:PQQ-binding-like beta-propeller repeat protein [Candidatus Acidoferrales bacterium]
MNGRVPTSTAPFGAAILVVLGLAIYAQSGGSAAGAGPWPVAGHDLSNSRNQPTETRINTANVGSLAAKWVFRTAGDVSATPTVGADAVYVPDWAGNLYAIRKDNGQAIWSAKISQYDGVPGAVSRVSPAIHGNDLIVGDIGSPGQPHDGARIMAVDRQSGVLHWMTQVEKNPAAIITGSPVVVGDMLVAGISSNEESLANVPGYVCCTFRGSMVALDANSGKILWQTYTVPDNGGNAGGYSGGAIWQPPAIDTSAGLIYVGTGNNYTVPDAVETCQKQVGAGMSASCMDPADHFDSVLALDIRTGAIMWSKQLQGYDAWTVACGSRTAGTTCPSPTGPDYDLGGSGPNLLPGLVGIGQKSGIFWGLDPSGGDILWSAVVGPGSTIGGIEWGTASDGERIYAAIANNLHNAYKLAHNGPTITWGSWSALDARTGRIVWQTADPTKGAIDPGAMSVANGVVYAGSYSGLMHAMDARTGAILWSFDSGGSVVDGPAIADGVVYWGSGYTRIGPGKPNNQVFAFAPGQ